MFADGQMQNGHADAAGKRWRPQAAKQRGKLAQRAVIVVTGVLLFVLGAKLGPSAGKGLSNAHVSEMASTVTSSLHLTGGAQLTPDIIKKIEDVHADYERRHFVTYTPDFEMFIRNIKVAVDGHQLPQRVLVHIFADAPNNVTLSPVVIPRCDGMWLEFGVHVGGTITHTGNWKLKNCPKDSGLVHGFDTFTGLPEDWGPGYQKGAFDLEGKFPPVPANVKLWKGLFSDSLPGFIKEMDAKDPNGKFMINYLHVDCDLYVGAKDVLTMLEDRILPGAIVVFDELVNYPAYRDHEVKAMWEWLRRTGRKLEVIGMMGPLQQLKRADAMDLNPPYDLGGYQQSVGFIAL